MSLSPICLLLEESHSPSVTDTPPVEVVWGYTRMQGKASAVIHLALETPQSVGHALRGHSVNKTALQALPSEKAHLAEWNMLEEAQTE